MIINQNRFLTSDSRGVGTTSVINFDTLTSSNSNTITIPTGRSLRGTDVGSITFPGSVVQTVTGRYDAQVSIATGTGLAGVEVSGMRLRITPKFLSSMILCQFQVFSETPSIDNIFRVFKNGTLIEGSQPAYNTVIGNQHWSGISMMGSYEIDYSSTPFTTLFYYVDFPNTLSEIFYSPALKNASGSNVTIVINRTVSSTGASGNEIGVSYGTLWEISQ